MTQSDHDEPDEHTALLQSDQQSRYETTTTSVGRVEDVKETGTERDSLLGRPDYESAAALAPEPVKPVFSPKATASSSSSSLAEGDVESDSRSISSSGSHSENPDDDTAAAAAAAGNENERPRTYLVHTQPARFRVVFAGIMLTYFMALFDMTIMASSHPVITSHFRASNMASWLTTAFLLTSTVFQPLVARLSDAVGRKPLYLTSIAVFAGATAWCALATSIGSFIAARAVCGFGAGGMLTCGAIAISDCVPIEQRGTYQSVINVIYGLAAASGAAFGGFLADTLGWRWEFGVQLVPIALCLATAVLSMPGDLGIQDGQKRQTLMQALRGFDFKGSILLTTSTTFLILGLNLGGNVLPWSHPLIITSLAIFVVFFPICLYVESLVERPIMPLELLHSKPRANMIFSNAMSSFLLNAILFNVPLFFQAVLLKSPTQSGLYLVVPTATASITGTITGVLISRLGRLKWPLVSGAGLYLLGTILLSSMQRSWPTWAFLLCLVPAAMGQGFQFPGTFIAVLAASTHADQAVATSTLQLWRAIGNVLGVAVSSLVFQNALLRSLILNVSFPPGLEGEEGEEWKRRYIEHVRGSIEAVAKLPEGRGKDQVVMSYDAACRATFLVCLGVALVSFLLIIPIKLPRLGKK